MSVPIRILRLAISLGVVTGIPPAVSPSGRKHPALGYALFDHCLRESPNAVEVPAWQYCPKRVYARVGQAHEKLQLA